MKTQKRNFIGLFMLTIFLTLTTVASAQQGAGFRHGMKKGNGMGMNKGECRIPDLTEEQQSSINTMRSAHMEEMSEMHSDMRILNEQYRDVTSGPDYSVKAAGKKIEEISTLKEKMMKSRLAHRNAVRNLLTDEQKIIFDQHQPGRKGQGFGRGQRFHGGEGFGPHGKGKGRGLGRGDCPKAN